MGETFQAVVVETSSGRLEGRRKGDLVEFRGVQYATVERFAPPRQLEPWSGVRQALRHGAQCFQILGPLEMGMGAGDFPMAEDCLTLSVVTPACDDGARPVVVWIHGGAFLTGNGSMPWYHGGALAHRGDVVVVSINYRLGIFGFTGTSNLGTLDQIAALEWVHDNIAAFGGDPGNVTILGESAGGASVVSLLAAPATDGLVHRAWAMSPSIGQFRTPERADRVLDVILQTCGVDSIDDLAAAPVDALMTAQAAVIADRTAGFDRFSPTAGGDGLPSSICDAAAANPVPLVIGTTRDECTLFVMLDPTTSSIDRSALRDRVEETFSERAADVIALYEELRPGASPAAILAAVQTDQLFRVPAHRLADARVEASNPTWSTWFTWQSAGFGGVLGACHGLDIPFAFDNIAKPGVDVFTGDVPGREVVARAHSDAVISFARSGTGSWEPVSGVARPTLRIDNETSQIDDPEPTLRDLWGAGRAGA